MQPQTLTEYWESFQQTVMPDIRKDGMTYRMARKTFLFGATAILSKIEDELRLLPDDASPLDKGAAVQRALGDAANELAGLSRPQPREPREPREPPRLVSLH